ncbi:MAG: hypothetical protein LBE34_01395 [Flavobacteriaceae bacterium]|jgi:hypothetical protein|nr:hypothetical protein [Flavobacteriaceae bacterium]
MRILKYFLLLLLLFTISLTVFILTQSGEFKVHKTFTLDAPQPVIYEYIHNIDNWNDWIPTTKKENAVYDITIDKIGNYQIRQEYNHPYDSLSQDILKDQKISNLVWKFKPNGKKTNVTFTFEGDLDLQTKISTFFYGTPSDVASQSIDKNINALIVYFIKQYKNYEIETNGIKNIKGSKYLYISSTTDMGTFETDIVKLDKKLRNFCSINDITITDTPFIILRNSLGNKSISFDFALPIKEKLFLNEEEIFKIGEIKGNSYFETIFKGHYAHLKAGLIEINHAITRGDVSVVSDRPTILKLRKSSAESKRPAEWETIFYIPAIPIIKDVPVTSNSYGNTYSTRGTVRDSINTISVPSHTPTTIEQ